VYTVIVCNCVLSNKSSCRSNTRLIIVDALRVTIYIYIYIYIHTSIYEIHDFKVVLCFSVAQDEGQLCQCSDSKGGKPEESGIDSRQEICFFSAAFRQALGPIQWALEFLCWG
jgi:hypothetical protein